MTIRSLLPSDLDELKRLHSLYFENESPFPDFTRFVCAFVVQSDKDGGIITAGGIRSIPELVIVTDKARTPQCRMKALYQMLDASIFVTQKSGHDQIYAWSHDKKWFRRMQKSFGFRPTDGQPLILDL